MPSGPDDAGSRPSVGGYRLLGELGRDPLGVLFVACPAGARTFPKWAVVRRMHPSVAHDQVMVQAFLSAAHAAVRMVHRNIASTFDFGGKRTLPWTAREHLFGIPLVDMVDSFASRRVSVPWALAAHLVAEAAEGVAAVRARIPNDGPPMGFLAGAAAPCIWVTQGGQAKIVDGCLPLLGGAPLVDSRSLPYLSPHIVPAPVAAGRSDVFGMAVALWELISGRRLFAGRDDDETYRLLRALVVPSLWMAGRVPPALDEIIKQAVGKSAPRDVTLTDASALARELRGLLQTERAHVGSEDVERFIEECCAGPVTSQRTNIAKAWAVEQRLQATESGVGQDPRESEETMTDLETLPEMTVQSRAPGGSSQRPDTLDEEMTVQTFLLTERVASRALGAGSSPPPPPPRPAASPQTVRMKSAPPPPPPRPAASPHTVRMESAPPPRPVPRSDPPRPPWTAPAGDQSERTLPVLPPVEWALQVPPPAKPVARASAMARLAERPRRKSPLLVAGGASFLLTSAIIAVVVLVQHPDPPPQPVPAAVSAVASASATASAPPSVAEPAPAPSSTIPVLSPGELPLVQGRPPGATPAPQSQPRSHPRLSFSPPPQAAADTPALGQLTVVCTPACDEVFDGARSLGPSPVFKAPVSAGVHRLRLHLDDGPTDKVVTVTVTGGDTAVVREAVGK